MSALTKQAKTTVKATQCERDDFGFVAAAGCTLQSTSCKGSWGSGCLNGSWTMSPAYSLTNPQDLCFVTHMEHHSNHISWLETIATVEIIRPDEDGNVDLQHLRKLLKAV